MLRSHRFFQQTVEVAAGTLPTAVVKHIPVLRDLRIQQLDHEAISVHEALRREGHHYSMLLFRKSASFKQLPDSTQSQMIALQNQRYNAAFDRVIILERELEALGDDREKRKNAAKLDEILKASHESVDGTQHTSPGVRRSS